MVLNVKLARYGQVIGICDADGISFRQTVRLESLRFELSSYCYRITGATNKFLLQIHPSDTMQLIRTMKCLSTENFLSIITRSVRF